MSLHAEQDANGHLRCRTSMMILQALREILFHALSQILGFPAKMFGRATREIPK
jgi:hypothetical protein